MFVLSQHHVFWHCLRYFFFMIKKVIFFKEINYLPKILSNLFLDFQLFTNVYKGIFIRNDQFFFISTESLILISNEQNWCLYLWNTNLFYCLPNDYAGVNHTYMTCAYSLAKIPEISCSVLAGSSSNIN